MQKKEVLIKIKKIIRESINIIFENQDIREELYEQQTELIDEIFNDFLYNNNEDFSKKIPIKQIPFLRLKKIWEDFMNMGVVRDEKGIDMIEDVITTNTLKVNAMTELVGHTSEDPEEIYDENIGYFVRDYLESRKKNIAVFEELLKDEEEKEIEIIDPNQLSLFGNDEEYIKKPKEINPEKFEILYNYLKEQFIDNYSETESGEAFFSDYALESLNKLLIKIKQTFDYSKKIPILDQMLNIIHMRSDVASWYVEGGSKALSQLSGQMSEPEIHRPY